MSVPCTDILHIIMQQPRRVFYLDVIHDVDWALKPDANCSGMVMFPFHQVWRKPILHDTVKGGRRQGKQRKRWEDNIREWAGLEFGKFQRAVENRDKWRKLVAKSSVVPQRPSRLRDR